MNSKVKNKVKDEGGRKPRRRARICVLLGSDLHHSAVAKRLGVSQAYISSQAKILVEDNALIPIKAGRERFYKRGPNFAKYERLRMDDTWGEESPSAPSNRFHHISARCEIENPKTIDLSRIPWDGEWNPRPEQTFRKLVLSDLKATVIVHDLSSLNIWIHDVEDVPEDPDAITNAHIEIQQRIFEVIKHLSKRCGFALSLPIVNRKMHISQELPELNGIKTGKIPIDEEGDEYIDDSPGGQPEHEVENIQKAKMRATAYKVLPDMMQRLAEYIASNNRREKKDEEVIETVLRIATEQNERHNHLIMKIEEIIKLNKNGYEPPPDDEDPKGYV